MAGPHIDFVRTGGLGGLRLSASVDVDALPPDAASRVREALGGVDLTALAARPPGPPSGADRFQYDIRVTDGSGMHAITALEPDTPPELRRLIDALVPLAAPG